MVNREIEVDVAMEGLIYDIWSLASFVEFVVFGFTHRVNTRAAHEAAAYVSKIGGNNKWNCIGLEFFSIFLQKM